jgi:hypothetical protein
MFTHPPSRVPAWLPPPDFERLLAYYRAGDREAPQWQAVRDLLGQPRWRAHWDSIQHLEVQRAAALQDGRELRTFRAVTPFCQALACGGARVFAELAHGSSPGVGTAAEWRQHANECVYCRRMHHRWRAARVRGEQGVPEDEPLLADWLLERHYAEALDALTADLSSMPAESLTDLQRGNLPLFLTKMRFVAPLLLECVLPGPERLAELTQGFLEFLERPEVVNQLRRSAHVRDEMGPLLGRFLAGQGVCDEDTVRAAVPRNVVDNVLWQLAAADCRDQAHGVAEQDALRAAQEALRQRLRSRNPTPADRVTAEALDPYLRDAPEVWSSVKKEFERLLC